LFPGDPWWRRAEKVREWKKKFDETIESAERLRDPDTRVQEIVKQVRKWLPKLIKKVCGKAPPIDNPYFDNLLDFFEEAVDAFEGVEAGRRRLVRADELVGKVNETAIDLLKAYRPEGPQGRRLKKLLDQIRSLKEEERLAVRNNWGLVRDWWINPRLEAAEAELDDIATDLYGRLALLQAEEDIVKRLVGEYRKKLKDLREKEGKFQFLYKAFGGMEAHYGDELGTAIGEISNGRSRQSSPEQRAAYAAGQARRRAREVLEDIERAYGDETPAVPAAPLPPAPPTAPTPPAPPAAPTPPAPPATPGPTPAAPAPIVPLT
jgi:hypothetical protein